MTISKNHIIPVQPSWRKVTMSSVPIDLDTQMGCCERRLSGSCP